MKKQNQDKLSDILPDGHYPVASGTDAYFSFLKKCIEEDPLYDEGELKQAGATFSKHSRAIQNEILNFKIQASQYPLMMAIFLWAQWISDDRVFGEKYLSMMQELVETNILIHKGLRDGNPVSLSEFALWDAETIVEYIRCVEKWPIEKREDYVKFYCEFSHWLSKHTFGFIPIAVDQNREVTQQRKLPFELYIKFLMNLEQREQIMVKLFYLGGHDKTTPLSYKELYPHPLFELEAWWQTWEKYSYLFPMQNYLLFAQNGKEWFEIFFY